MTQSFVCVGIDPVAGDVASSLRAAGYRQVSDVSEAQVVFVFTTALEEAEDVLLESDGVLAQAQPGTYIVCLGCLTPLFARELSALATVSGLHAVEAPLVLSTFMREHPFSDPSCVRALVSGDQEDVDAMLPLVQSLAAQVSQCGSAGSASLAKCAAVIQQAAQVLAVAEIDALCRLSADANALRPVMAWQLEAGLASPQALELAQMVNERSFDLAGFSIDDFCCEVQTALAAADEVGLVMPQLESAEYLLRLVAAIGGQNLAPAAVALAYADDEVEDFGLDWDQADAAFRDFDEFDEYADEEGGLFDALFGDDDLDLDGDDEDEEGFGQAGLGRMGFGGLGGYSAN